MTESAPVPATGCCPRFDPAAWQEKVVEFQDRLFVKDRVRSVLHIPLNFGRVMQRNLRRIDAAGALPDQHDMMVLSDENSLWGADVYIAVTKEVPGAEHARLTGRFLTKAFDGPYKDIRKWMQRMQEYVTAQGATAERVLFYYTTCPRCAKAYGHNWVVLMAQV